MRFTIDTLVRGDDGDPDIWAFEHVIKNAGDVKSLLEHSRQEVASAGEFLDEVDQLMDEYTNLVHSIGRTAIESDPGANEKAA